MTARYFIECAFTDPIFNTKRFAFVERDSNAMSFDDTAWDIATGQVENVVKVIGCRTHDGDDDWTEDCTRAVAEAVYEICMDQYGEIPLRLRDWIDEHVGLKAEVE